MIAGLKPYSAMKDSGMPWLGEVPEHWDTRRLKQTFRRIVGGSTPSSAEASFWDGDVAWVTPADVSKNSRLSDSVRRITRDGLRSCSAELVPAGSLIVTSRAPVGNVAIAETELCTNQGCKALVTTPAIVDPMFGFHVLTTLKDELQSLGTGTTFTEVSTSRIGAVSIPLPPLPEQAAIVRFLDYADRRIRRYVRGKQRLIGLLEEQKQAIIHRAVTRGLDPNVRLKPSGVEWLGDVPEHWEVLPLCAIARPRKETNQSHRELLSVYLGRGVIPFSAVDEKRTNPTSEDLSKYQAVEPGDFVLNNQQAWRGSVGISRFQGIVSPAYLVLALDGRLLLEFADRLLPGRGMVAQYLVSSKGVGSIQRNLYWPHLRRVAVPVPPSVEQVAIARLLEKATASVATTIERTNREIALLREYRTRLIADVVTGKLDVREAAARLPDEVEESEPVDETDTLAEADDGIDNDFDAAPEETEA